MMIPVDQTLFGKGKGNCHAACIASILELPLDDVPHVMLEKDWMKAERDFLASKGYREIYFQFHTDDGKLDTETLGRMWSGWYSDLYFILSGVSPRKADDGSVVYHSVIGRAAGYGFEVVHDPHFSREGIVGNPYSITLIFPAEKNSSK